MSDIQLQVKHSISEIPLNDWQALLPDTPFNQYEFLQLLEQHSVVGEGTGWYSHFIAAYIDGKLIAVMPLYKKYHSMGEYVFDHAWSQAYQQYGFDYYPKLVSSIPYTPISGARVLIHPELSDKRTELYKSFYRFISEHNEFSDCSSFHLLFPLPEDSQILCNATDEQLAPRKAVHFKWFNRQYESFNAFLDAMTSRKRKQIKKERKVLTNHNLVVESLEGKDITSNHWDHFYLCYQLTYAKRSGHGGYLPKSFFYGLSESMPNNLLLMMVRDLSTNKYIAGALNFKSERKLYGRYWGCTDNYDALHFETCYYQGIDYCIKNKLIEFDPGVQGEHKIARGFEPVFTFSNHWIKDEGFRHAIGRFLKEESAYVDSYFKEVSELSPFKASTT